MAAFALISQRIQSYWIKQKYFCQRNNCQKARYYICRAPPSDQVIEISNYKMLFYSIFNFIPPLITLPSTGAYISLNSGFRILPE